MALKSILLDIDGVLCIRNKLIEGAPQTLKKLKEKYRIALVTNTTRAPSKSILEMLRGLGFEVEEEEIFTPLKLVRDFLLKSGAGAYFLVSEGAKAEFEGMEGFPIKYVVVADAYTNFTYQSLNEAFRLLLKGAELIGLAPNRYFMDTDGELSLDAGPFIKALEYASGKSATVIGKPSPEFFKLVLEHVGAKPEEAIMVGDDIEFDVLGAQKNRIRGVLVKTGKFREEDLKKGINPDYIIETINDLPGLIDSIQEGRR